MTGILAAKKGDIFFEMVNLKPRVMESIYRVNRHVITNGGRRVINDGCVKLCKPSGKDTNKHGLNYPFQTLFCHAIYLPENQTYQPFQSFQS